MVVSIKSILPEDVSGEGTVSDYSQEEWPRQVLQVHGESIVPYSYIVNDLNFFRSKKSFCSRKYPSGDGNGVQRCGESSGAVYILGSRILQK